MLTGKEIHVLDINSEFYGTPTIKLMENAGKNVADLINKKLKLKEKNIIVFCGTGNNGGDGFVAARHLSEKHNVTVFLTGKPNDIKTDISKKNFEKIKNNKKTKIYNITNISKIVDLIPKNDLIIDAMLGIGLSGELRQPYNTIVKQINKTKNKIIYENANKQGYEAYLENLTLGYHFGSMLQIIFNITYFLSSSTTS